MVKHARKKKTRYIGTASQLARNIPEEDGIDQHISLKMKIRPSYAVRDSGRSEGVGTLKNIKRWVREPWVLEINTGPHLGQSP